MAEPWRNENWQVNAAENWSDASGEWQSSRSSDHGSQWSWRSSQWSSRVGFDNKIGILRHQSVETDGQTQVGDLTGIRSIKETPQVTRIGRHYLMDERYPEMSMDKIDIVENFDETIMDFLAGMMEPCHHR